jgi:plasmid stabilization system protein ParE
MYTVLFSERAAKDIISIVEYIAADNAQAAEKLGSNLIELALSLNSMPHRGSRVKNRPGTLKLILGNYLIYYRVNEAKRTAEIIRFLHGARIR